MTTDAEYEALRASVQPVMEAAESVGWHRRGPHQCDCRWTELSQVAEAAMLVVAQARAEERRAASIAERARATGRAQEGTVGIAVLKRGLKVVMEERAAAAEALVARLKEGM